MIFRNHNNMLICCSRNISDYYQCWKQSCCTIFLWRLWYSLFFRIHRWTESSEEQHLFEIEISSMMNKSINYFFFLNLTDPKLLNTTVQVFMLCTCRRYRGMCEPRHGVVNGRIVPPLSQRWLRLPVKLLLFDSLRRGLNDLLGQRCHVNLTAKHCNITII